MGQITTFRRRPTALAWFTNVHDQMMNREVQADPRPLEAKSHNQLFSVAAILCIYADNDLRIRDASKQFLAGQIGLGDAYFSAALRDLVNMRLLRRTPHHANRPGSFELLIVPGRRPTRGPDGA